MGLQVGGGLWGLQPGACRGQSRPFKSHPGYAEDGLGRAPRGSPSFLNSFLGPSWILGLGQSLSEQMWSML